MTQSANQVAQPSRWQAYAQLFLRLGLVAAIVASAFVLLSSDKGLVQNYLLGRKIEELNTRITAQREQNRQLERTLASLRTDTDMIEYIARRELMMVGEKEILFDLPPHRTH